MAACYSDTCLGQDSSVDYMKLCPNLIRAERILIRIKFLTTDNTDNIPTSWLTAH